jgi:tetratricopeptide (TPR) repeat protein
LLGDHGGDALLFDKVGIVASNAGEYERAVGYFEVALDIQPVAAFYYDLAVAHLRAGRAAQARSALELAVARLPDYLDALTNLAGCYTLLGEWVAAYLVLDRVRALYAGRTAPAQLGALWSMVQDWLYAGLRPDTDAAHPDATWTEQELAVVGLDAWEEGQAETACQAFTEISRKLPADSASAAIAQEFAATAAYYLDRHGDYLKGAARRREVVPCAQALVPSMSGYYLEAGILKDATALCHRIIRRLDPDHSSRMVATTRSKTGPRDAIYRNFTVFVDGGHYKIEPVGNRVIVTDPAGKKHEIADYVGEFEPLRMA